MADSKRLRVSKACDSCRRKKVKCDAIHPLCTNCETFNYECTYNDPTKKRGPPKGKLVPMMTGYIEAIEARLHRMEGLLGGLVKDKDPRAEIVRAELDAMAREAEMTGLKLRRSKAYEEINNAMASGSTSSSAKPSETSAGPSGPSESVRPTPPQTPQPPQPPPPLQQHQRAQPPHQASSHLPQHQQPPIHQQQQQQQHLQHILQQQQQQPQQYYQRSAQTSAAPPPPALTSHARQPQSRPAASSPHQQTEAVNSQGSSYRTHSENSGHDEQTFQGVIMGRSQSSLLQPSALSSPRRTAPYHPYDSPRHPRSPHTPQQQHQLPPQATSQLPPPLMQSSNGTGSAYNSPHQQQHHNNKGYGHGNYNQSAGNNNGRGPPGEQHPYDRDQYRLERDHHRSISGESNRPYDYPSAKGFPLMESHRIVTHRPSLAAHQLSNPLTGYMPMNDPKNKEESLIMPSMDVMDHLLKVHFRSVHPVLPMLHFKTLSDQIHRNESPPYHLIFAVLGLSSRFSDNPVFRTPQPGADMPPSAIFYERAKHFVKEEYDNSQLATVQALLLIAIQQMGFCESQRAWLCVGVAIRMAQDLGLNKEISGQEQARNRLQSEMKKRTWWSIYVIERLLCAGLNRPLAITQKDCETGYPKFEDEELDVPTGSAPVVRSGIISNFVHMITLSKIQGNVLEFIKAKFSPPAISASRGPAHPQQSPSIGSDQDREYKVDTSPAAFATLDRSLSDWRQKLPAHLQSPTADSPQFGLFLHLSYNTLVILLHRPNFSNSQTSASVCTQAAATITEITEILMDSKALTSMFISCLYAVFSAGVIHFMNIPSVRPTGQSATSSPVLSEPEPQSSQTSSAKTNLKRCIDALKFLASQWVSAARRAKILEDLLDLKHVSLKDLEEETFQTSPVGPSWALESASRYKVALVAPREDHDKLRQQCRSKAMAIHSLLASDDDYKRMHARRSHSFDDRREEETKEVKVKEDQSMDTTQDGLLLPKEEPELGSPALSSAITSPLALLANGRRNVGLGVQSPMSSTTSVESPNSVRTDGSGTSQTAQDTDPTVVLSTAQLGISDSPAGSTEKIVPMATSGPIISENDFLTPITMTTLIRGSSPLLGFDGRSGGLSPSLSNPQQLASRAPLNRQGTMLDPFSVPSSISFPEWNNGSSANGNSVSPLLYPRGSQPLAENKALAMPSVPTTVGSYGDSAGGNGNGNNSSNSNVKNQRTGEKSEHDLVWNDMPPTLGLDEWTAYIGAMMMRWLASGQSSPRSSAS
ncbi:hypothetical protein EMPS_08542 [Entomortierella parvispora]|uniref:Zn(2)-C6 fungal-type domain-containing protein n=1 Tax=Entomortierella parvispora TaxID=205924 RepID=A0A9P3HGL5_9FUNG|nr:hypothetical protein EMPS_08542 [Entomortierella parvispora]